MRLFVITGTTRGLGRAFYELISKSGQALVCISRSFDDEQIHKSNTVENMELIRLDLSEIDKIEVMLETSHLLKQDDFDELVFISNAGMSSPHGRVSTMSGSDMSAAMAVNYMAPVVLSNVLLQCAIRNNMSFKVLNMSSGAASHAFEAWSIYCSSKAAAKMFFDVLEKEGSAKVRQIDPGVLETDMQTSLRNSNQNDFPMARYFRELKDKGKLKGVMETANSILTEEGLI